MTDLTCPECGHVVDRTGMSTAYGIGDRKGNVSYQPHQEHTTCPGCGKKLARMADADSPWRVDA